jgi:fibronectin-binding autotransporter adhesin
MSKQSRRAGCKVVLSGAVTAAALSALPQVALSATDTWVGNTSANWADLNWTGDNNPPMSGDSLVFGTAGSSGTTLTDNLTAGGPAAWGFGGITFNAGADAFIINPSASTFGFTLNGGINDNATNAEVINDQIALPAIETITVAAGGSLMLGGVISGAGGGIISAGSGTLILSAANTFTGGLTISGTSTVQIAADNNLGGGAVTLDGGTLKTTAGITETTRVINVDGNGGTISVNGGQLFLNHANLLTGSGPLTVVGVVNAGTQNANLRLGAANTFSGTVTIQNGGNFEYGAAGAVASTVFNVNSTGELDLQGSPAVTLPAAATINLNGGTISFENGNGGVYASSIVLGASGGTVGLRDWYKTTTARSGLISGAISGTGGLSTTGGGTLTLTGANTYAGTTTIASGSTLQIGSGGTSGTLGSGSVSDNGTLTFRRSDSITLSNVVSGTGAVIVASGSLTVPDTGSISTATLAVGSASGVGAAVYQQAGSTVTNTSSGGGAFQIGSTAGAAGYYALSGGTLNIGGELDPGGSGGAAGTFGQFDMSGGTVNLPNSTSAYVLPDRGAAGEASVMNVSGGTIQIAGGGTPANSKFNGLAVGLNNVGNLTSTVTIGGTGQFLTPSLTVKLNDTNFGASSNSTNVSVLNMNGGTLQTLGFGTAVNTGGGNGSAIINFNGGTIMAGIAGNTSFLGGLGAVNVYSGNGTIDNNGQAITIGQPLLAASGTGVSSAPVATSGTGYAAPPRVVFNGGTLTGGLLANTATGYATIDPTTGAVAGIVITNPGSYASTSGLTVALTGPTGGTAASLGALTLNGGNTSGGMTFQGSGTTTLAGASTFTGPATLTAGMLKLTGSLAAPVTVQSGATLTGSGNGTTTGLISGAVTLNGGAAIDFSKDGLTAPTTLMLGNGLSIGSNSGPATNLTFNFNSTLSDLINLTGGSLNAFAAPGTPNLINLNLLGSLTPGNTTYTLVQFGSGQTNVTNSNLNSLFALGTVPSGLFSLSLAVTNTSLELVESAQTVPIAAYWTGKNDNAWSDVNTSPLTTNFSSTKDGRTDPGQLPGVTSDVIFTADANGSGTSLSGAAISTTLGSDFTINSLTINSTPSSVTIGGSNTLTLNAAASQSGSGSLGYTAGTGLVIQSGAGPVTLGTSAVALGGPQTWTNASSSNLTVNAVITGAAANGLTINNTGTGATIFNAANTFAGGLTLANGLLQVGGSGTFGPANGTVAVNGGTLDLNGTNQSIGNLTGTGGTILDNASGTVSVLTIGTGNAGGGNYAGTIADSTNGDFAEFLSLIKAGSGAITLSGANQFSGGTRINGGILQFASVASLPQYNVGGSLNVVNNSGVLAVNYGGPNDWTAGQVDTLRANVTFNAGSAIGFDTTNAPAGGATYASTIGDGAGSMGVLKLGPNTLTLAGNNTYSGYTAVRGGTLNLAGTSSMTGGIYVDNGTLNLTGGTFGASTTNNTFIVATNFQNGTGVLTIAPGVSLTRANLFVGDNGVGAGAVYQSGGSLTLTQGSGVDNIRIGSAANGIGYYNLSGGSITSNELDVAGSLANTIGVMDMSGGTVAINGLGYIIPGRGTGTSSGVINLTGGAMTGNRIEMNWASAAGATSVLDLGGGTGPASLATAGSTTLGLNLLNNNTAGTLSVVNLLPNGMLTTGIVKATAGANPVAHLNFNGGTLVATATNAGSGFFAAGANLDAVNVLAGGGTIDNGGTNITITNALLAPAGYGVAANSIAAPAGGAGYIGAPLVKFTGGSGIGATGYAVVSNGAVTNIVVTSPGIGYAAGDTLTATFFGGGGTAAASPVTGIPVAQNVSGGMIFQGAGTTILTATNTWMGKTNVTIGTLEVDGSLADTPVTVASSATLSGKGVINNAGANALTVNGTIAPGTASSTAKFTTGAQAWNAGGNYTWKLNTNNAPSIASISAGTNDPGGAGANWDTLSMSSLTVPSTGSFTINLSPFSGTGSNPFNGNSNYAWTIADVSTGQGNYASLLANLALNAAPLATATNTAAADYSLGLMSDGGSGQDLVVSYSPAPEPTSLALAGLAAGGVLLRRRRR